MLTRIQTVTKITRNIAFARTLQILGLFSRMQPRHLAAGPCRLVSTNNNKHEESYSTTQSVFNKEAGLRQFIAKTYLCLGGTIVSVLCTAYADPTAMIASSVGWTTYGIGVTSLIAGGNIGMSLSNYKVTRDRAKGDSFTPVTTFLYSEQSLVRKLSFGCKMLGISLFMAPFLAFSAPNADIFVLLSLYTTLTVSGAVVSTLTRKEPILAHNLYSLSASLRGGVFAAVSTGCLSIYMVVDKHVGFTALVTSEQTLFFIPLLVLLLKYKTNVAVKHYLRGDPDHLGVASSLVRLL